MQDKQAGAKEQDTSAPPPVPIQRNPHRSKKVDITIVGGGIAGASVAFLLAKTKLWKRILLLERGEIGSGSTQASAACFRQQFTRIFNVLLNKISFDLYRGEFARVLGYNPLRSVGYLFLKSTKADMTDAMKQAANQIGWGVAVEALAPRAVSERWPFLDTSKIVGAIFGKNDGFVKSPSTIAAVLAETAATEGVDIIQRVQVNAIETKDGEVRSVNTTSGIIETGIVINCAGAWSGVVAGMAGSYLPVRPIPRQLAIVNSVRTIPQDTTPMIICPEGAYFRPEGQVLICGYAPANTPSSFQAHYDPEVAIETIGLLSEYVPSLAEAEIRPQGVCGLYETTTDHNGLIGSDARVRGLFHCSGFSGHGVMQAPGAAQLIVELLQHGDVRSLHPLVYAPLRADRFERSGISWREENVI